MSMLEVGMVLLYGIIIGFIIGLRIGLPTSVFSYRERLKSLNKKLRKTWLRDNSLEIKIVVLKKKVEHRINKLERELGEFKHIEEGKI